LLDSPLSPWGGPAQSCYRFLPGVDGRRAHVDQVKVQAIEICRPIMQALVDIGYKGYVGQEFIPTRDPLKGLQEAVTLCNV